MRHQNKFDWLSILMFISAATLIAYFIISPGHEHLEEGGSAPLQTEVTSFDGTKWRLSRFVGKPMLVNFWASWCPPCLDELPVLSTLSYQYKDDVIFLGLAVDSPAEDVQKLVEKFGLKYPIAQTNIATLEAWKASTLPTTYLLDKEGNVAWHYQGEISFGQVKSEIDELLSKQ